MLNLLNEGKRVINIDETWIPRTDFRRMKWRKRGDTNSISQKYIGNRVNMIAAIDNHGEVFLSLTQVNTDTNVMLMFLSRLAIRLT